MIASSITGFIFRRFDAAADSGSFWLPPAASDFAADVDRLFFLFLWTGAFIAACVAALLIWLARRNQASARPGPRPAGDRARWRQIASAAAALAGCAALFYSAHVAHAKARSGAEPSLEILVSAKQWTWFFTYPNGWVDRDLHLEAGQTARLTLRSDDVIHSLSIPAFRLAYAIRPGIDHAIAVHPSQPGDYALYCTRFCGTHHSGMAARVIVHESGAMEAWLEGDARPWWMRVPDDEFELYRGDPEGYARAHPDLAQRYSDAAEFGPLSQAGEALYSKFGCVQCHSLEEEIRAGPSFRNIYGAPVDLEGGLTVVVDQAYIRESVLRPEAKIVKSFKNKMPTYEGLLKEREILALAAFIQSLSESASDEN